MAGDLRDLEERVRRLRREVDQAAEHAHVVQRETEEVLAAYVAASTREHLRAARLRTFLSLLGPVGAALVLVLLALSVSDVVLGGTAAFVLLLSLGALRGVRAHTADAASLAKVLLERLARIQVRRR